MFDFGQKYHISVVSSYDYKENKISYIKDIDKKTYQYTTTCNIKMAKLFTLEKAGEICNVLRKQYKGISYRVC